MIMMETLCIAFAAYVLIWQVMELIDDQKKYMKLLRQHSEDPKEEGYR